MVENIGVSLSELNTRALAVITRLHKITAPLVGIPLGPGMKPFVTRRELLEGQVNGLENVIVEMDISGASQVLRLSGTFGVNGTGRHSAAMVNMQRGCNFTIWKWADQQRQKPRTNVTTIKRSRSQAKVAKIDAEIAKLERRLTDKTVKEKQGGLYYALQRPTNPLLMDPEKDSEHRNREHALTYYLQKHDRKTISLLAVTCRLPKKVKVSTPPPVVDDDGSQFSFFDVKPKPSPPEPVEARRVSTRRGFPWTAFYSELHEAGIHENLHYSTVHGRVGGPRRPEEYLRNPRSFLFLGSKKQAGIYQYDLSEAMTEYITVDRKRYVEAMKEAASIRSMIESLKTQKQVFLDGGCDQSIALAA
jgi:hypothetical protein